MSDPDASAEEPLEGQEPDTPEPSKTPASEDAEERAPLPPRQFKKRPLELLVTLARLEKPMGSPQKPAGSDSAYDAGATYDKERLRVLDFVVGIEALSDPERKARVNTKTLIEQGKIDEALDLLKEHKEPAARVNRGCCYAHLNRFDDAKEEFQDVEKDSNASEKEREAARFNREYVLPDLRILYPPLWTKCRREIVRGLSRSWPIILVTIVAILAWVWPRWIKEEPPATPATVDEVALPVKASDLAGGTDLLALHDYLVTSDEAARPAEQTTEPTPEQPVTQAGEETTEHTTEQTPEHKETQKFVSLLIAYKSGKEGAAFETALYPNLRVVGLLDDNGRSVQNTGVVPSSIVFSVPIDKIDAMVKDLQREGKVVYLLPQGTGWVTPTPMPTVVLLEYADVMPLAIKADQLTTGAALARLNEYVTLAVARGDPTGQSWTLYYDLKVIGLLDAEGHSVAGKRVTPDTILLSVPADKFDAIARGLQQEKKVAYLLPQGTETVVPAATPAAIPPGEYGEQVQFQLKASDLASGAILARLDERVTLVLVTDEGGGKKSSRYEDLQALALLDANGHSVVGSGAKPDSILLSVPTDKFDAIAKGLQQEKKVAYLLPQGTDMAPTPTPTTPPTLGPIATVTANWVAFSLPADKILWDLKSLKPGEPVVVIVVVERKDADGKIVEHKAYRHDGATPLHVLDKDGVPLASPYEGAITVHISLPLGANGGSAVEFAGQLADASAIYFLKQE